VVGNSVSCARTGAAPWGRIETRVPTAVAVSSTSDAPPAQLHPIFRLTKPSPSLPLPFLLESCHTGPSLGLSSLTSARDFSTGIDCWTLPFAASTSSTANLAAITSVAQI